jgi:hypothetical protein
MLTKSDFMKYVECPVWLWLKKYKPELLPEDTFELSRRFEMGREVDLLSRRLFPGGVEAEGFNYDGWRSTKKLIDSGAKIIFQPTAVAGALTCRGDILIKNRSGWDLNEVKMTTQVKDEHYYDAAFQRLCFERAGIKISRVNLVHINNKYIRKGEINPKKLFASEDITEKVRAKTLEVQELIGKVFAMLKRKDAPDAELLKSCPDPKRCEYVGHYCEGFPGLHKIASEFSPEFFLILLERGAIDYKKIPADIVKLTGYKPEVEFSKIDAPAIRKELECLKYPLYFFDYETYMSAIPSFDGTRPYQQVPFQYSLLIKDNPGAKVRHSEFLAREFKNPAPDLLAQLKREVGPKGSVIVWFASFEMGCNEEMARMEPKYADFLKAMNGRIFDLMLIFKFKRQMYVKSEFQQSASLKKVLPVMCPELSYESLTIQEGGTAAASWPLLTGGTLAEKEKAQLAENMLAYCKRDTEAMVGILEKLEKEIKK